ncbi:MAG: adenosine deaminase, partial [Bacillota bacterium]
MDYTVSLHTHLEGSVRPETFSELMGNDIKADLTVNKNCTSLKEFLDKIACGYPLTQRRQNLKRVAYEIVESASQNNCLYLEVRFGPTLHTSGDMQLEDTVEAVLEGFNEGERNFGVVTRAIISTLRHEDPAVSIRLAKLASKYKDLGVVGFDIAGDEANFKALPHKRSFEIAKEAGLGITAHAGEAGEPGNVKEAILELNASRIGHGIRVIEDKEVVEIAKERGIVFEVCPTSNIH